MSTKQQLAEAIQTLPDTLSLEEAVETLYQLYKLKRHLAERDEQQRPERAAYDAVFAQKLPILRFAGTSVEVPLDLTRDDFVF